MISADVKPRRKNGIQTTIIFIVLFVVVIVGGFVYVMVKPRVLSEGAMRAQGLFLFERVRDIGDFALVDDTGKPFVPANLQGKWTLLYFGFTYCPDVCPTTLALLSQFYNQLPPEFSADTQIALVSVDPARDTPQKLHEYVHYFNPVFRGVTGEFLDLQKFATSLNVPFVKVPGGGDNYQVEHSGNVVLINPDGYYVGFFKSPQTLENLTKTYTSVRHSH
ncbi:MAG: SCO family protein [Spongiibacteraceae bacterium]